MDIEYLKHRLALLRTAKEISARELSLRLGQSEGYINQIESGKSKPSIEMMFYICEELGVTMSEFFDDSKEYPALINTLISEAKTLDKKSLESVIEVIRNMQK